MESFRSFVNSHISRNTHYFLLTIGIISLFASGKAFYMSFDNQLAEFDTQMSTLASGYVAKLSERNASSTATTTEVQKEPEKNL